LSEAPVAALFFYGKQFPGTMVHYCVFDPNTDSFGVVKLLGIVVAVGTREALVLWSS
jgi:hypothetical protein